MDKYKVLCPSPELFSEVGLKYAQKKFDLTIKKMSQKQLKRVLVNKGLIKKNSKAPTKLLTDIYLNSKLMGDINVIKN